MVHVVLLSKVKRLVPGQFHLLGAYCARFFMLCSRVLVVQRYHRRRQTVERRGSNRNERNLDSARGGRRDAKFARNERGLHLGGAPGRDRYHRGSGGTALAGSAGGPRSLAAEPVPEQFEADRSGPAQL